LNWDSMPPQSNTSAPC